MKKQKGCGEELIYYRFSKEEKDIDKRMIYWKCGENELFCESCKPQNHSQQGKINSEKDSFWFIPADCLSSSRRKIEFLPIMEKGAYYYLEQDVKEFIQRLCYNFMLKCSNAKDYNKFKEEIDKLAGNSLVNNKGEYVKDKRYGYNFAGDELR